MYTVLVLPSGSVSTVFSAHAFVSKSPSAELAVYAYVNTPWPPEHTEHPAAASTTVVARPLVSYATYLSA
ncbi:hypothetical protein R5W24_006328 [Gemmata sp. JC717]|uniref:hypothetical protein n=1 Tax=Gemmata algarum TaxID=2975278 RepID=UPI0021BBA117|nr:hypothetical protein [Gemmata algarum]MDY3557141.1 hypothetical protein [Gemmata algarum]